jgi:AraC-like DNA-binding protein
MVFSFNHQDIRFVGEVPSDLTRYQLSGGTVSTLSNDFLKMLLQEFETDKFRAYYSVQLVDRKCSFRIRDEGPLLVTCLALQNDRQFELPPLGKILIREGQFNIFYLPEFDLISYHEASKEYITLAIHYDQSIFENWAPYFPQLAEFLEKVNRKEAAALLPQSAWLTKEIHETVYKILHPHLQDAAQQVYFDLLVRTLLFHLLNQSVQVGAPSKYSHYEVESIQAAGEMIRKNLKYHFVIREIAQKVGMNEFKLKNGFRELFGNGVYEYLRLERMQAARNLLTERGRSIKEIAALTGYHSVNSFIKAFKKKYGETPGEFRKRA